TGYLGGHGAGSNPLAFPSAEARHNKVANYLFADGHVKALKGDAVSPGPPASSTNAAQIGNDLTGTAAGTQNTQFQATFSPI
ncbi:MAG TPA: H-X9-DG-CTERM domain-containing protein, partial [Abditibacteriaceae bacterium]